MEQQSTLGSKGRNWFWAAVVLVLTLGLWSGQVQAVDKYWNGTNSGTGYNWNNAANWNPVGVPQTGDNVYLAKNDATSWTVNYYSNPPAANLTNLYIFNSGAGFMALQQGYWGDSWLLSAQNEYIGGSGKGVYRQNGAINTCNIMNINTSGTYNLYGGTLQANTLNLNSGGVFNQTGGTVNANFSQNGGTVTGTFTNEWSYTYNSGTFSGQFINKGDVIFNNDFTAGNGMVNYSEFGMTAYRKFTFNGLGLENNAAIMLISNNRVEGTGPVVNNGYMNLNGSIRGGNTFTNNGIFIVNGYTDLQKTGGSFNNGTINLVANSSEIPGYPVLNLSDPPSTSYTLTNNGMINLTSNGIIWKGNLINNATGQISGGGFITSNFSNYGTLNIANPWTITNAFKNYDSGYINMGGGTLTGGAINNYGAIEGGSGIISNNISNHGLLGVGGEQNLRLTGVVTNASDGEILVRNSSRLTFTQGLAVNDGVIVVRTSSAFINNGFPLTNNGLMTFNGMVETGGITNSGTGKIYFMGDEVTDSPNTSVTGTLTNNTGGKVYIYDPVVFTNKVTNYGTIKTFGVGASTNPLVFAGGYEEHGTYNSDPRSQTFSSVIIGATGIWTGSTGDTFIIQSDFINQSKENLLWNTFKAELDFIAGDDGNQHLMTLAGADKGASGKGLENNFSWGLLDIRGQSLELADGNLKTPGGALYVGKILGAEISGDQITNIFGQNGLNIYYDPLLNGYLHGTYLLQEGGLLAPISASATPVPGTFWLAVTGFIILAAAGKRHPGNGRNNHRG